MPIGMPGWPELAFCTASMARARNAVARSRVSTVVVFCGEVCSAMLIGDSRKGRRQSGWKSAQLSWKLAVLAIEARNGVDEQQSPMVQMAFQQPADYQPGLVPPDALPERALWFVFRRSELLVSAEPAAAAVPRAAHPQALGLGASRMHYLGRLASEHCFA